jgi:hypothetical protein
VPRRLLLLLLLLLLLPRAALEQRGALRHVRAIAARQAAPLLEASQRLGDVRVGGTLRLSVREVGLDVGRFAHYRLDVLAPARALQVARELPLADAPVLHRTLARSSLGPAVGRAVARVARHRRVAPVGLPRHLAEAPAVIRLQVEADVVAPSIVLLVHALAGAREARERHAWPGASLERTAVHIQVGEGRRRYKGEHWQCVEWPWPFVRVSLSQGLF